MCSLKNAAYKSKLILHDCVTATAKVNNETTTNFREHRKIEK